MIRIEIDDAVLRGYALAFMQSPTGQALVRRDKTGSVVDHVSVSHLQAYSVPIFDREVVEQAGRMMAEAASAREFAREELRAVFEAFANELPTVEWAKQRCQGWTRKVKTIRDRIDAARWDPLVDAAEREFAALGGEVVGHLGTITKPAGRYKTRYIDSQYGRPICSGRQILQWWPMNLRFIDPAALTDVERYELRADAIVFQADGRAEERLGVPAMVTPSRDRWLASGHVGRLVAGDAVDAGSLFLAWRHPLVQHQIAARACGSVVDALYPQDLESVVLPPLPVAGSVVREAWGRFDEAESLERRAQHLIDQAMADVVGEGASSAA